MKSLGWVIAIIAAALVLVLGARSLDGFVLIVAAPWRMELSLNLAIGLAVAICGLVYLSLRAVSLALTTPGRVRQIHLRRARERARALFDEALGSFFEGRFGRAEKAAAAAFKAGESPALAAVLAARSAHGRRNYIKRDEYLAAPVATDGATDTLRVMARAEMLLDERRYRDALDVLRALPEKHSAALRLELRAQQMAKNWDRVLTLIPLLEKRRIFDKPVISQLRRQAHTELLKQYGHDLRSLRDYWQRLSGEQKEDPALAMVAAQCFVAAGGSEEASRIVEDRLNREWDSALLAVYADCAGADATHQLACAERWLQTHRRDATLLLTLGRLCARQGLWGKSRSYLEASLSIEETHSAHLELAQLYEREGNPGEAAAEYRKALEVTLSQLKSHAGGWRRPVL